MPETVTPTTTPTPRPWPFTAKEDAETERKLAARPDVLDWALRELAAIARDAENTRGRWTIPTA